MGIFVSDFFVGGCGNCPLLLLYKAVAFKNFSEERYFSKAEAQS